MASAVIHFALPRHADYQEAFSTGVTVQLSGCASTGPAWSRPYGQGQALQEKTSTVRHWDNAAAMLRASWLWIGSLFGGSSQRPPRRRSLGLELGSSHCRRTVGMPAMRPCATASPVLLPRLGWSRRSLMFWLEEQPLVVIITSVRELYARSFVSSRLQQRMQHSIGQQAASVQCSPTTQTGHKEHCRWLSKPANSLHESAAAGLLLQQRHPISDPISEAFVM
jgi:hypothetical protein